MNMNKKDVLEALKVLKKVPSDKDFKTRSQYWMKCSQLSKKLLSFNSDYGDIHGDLMNLVHNERNDIHGLARDIQKRRSDLEVGGKIVSLSKDDLEYWNSMTEDWVNEHMTNDKSGDKSQNANKLTTGWWYQANGKQVLLNVHGTSIDLSKRVRGTGKGIAIILCELLSKLNTKEVSKAAIEHELENRGEEFTGRTVIDAVRNLNSLVKSECKIEYDFLIPTDSGYAVSPKIWE